MCFFDQTRWTCGYWRWGDLRLQCPKKCRVGQTCGLKLIYDTLNERDECKLCHATRIKQRRYHDIYSQLLRRRDKSNGSASAGLAFNEMQRGLRQIYYIRMEHSKRLQSLL